MTCHRERYLDPGVWDVLRPKINPTLMPAPSILHLPSPQREANSQSMEMQSVVRQNLNIYLVSRNERQKHERFKLLCMIFFPKKMHREHTGKWSCDLS